MTARTEPLEIACAVVGDHLPHAAAMVASAIECGGEQDVTVHVMHDGCLPPRDWAAFAEMLGSAGIELRSHAIADERLAGLPTSGFTGKGSWYRIFLPGLLADVSRILYLDVDLLVTDSLRPLRAVDLSDAYVAAVTNVFEPAHVGRPAELGLASPAEYFNAGVLLMNLEAMRTDDCTTRLLTYGRENAARLLWRDQDALNVVLGRRRVHLHPRWNCMHSVMEFDQSVDVFGWEQVIEARRNPAIRHFEGPSLNKPWHYLAASDLRRMYAHHRRATPWPRVVPDDRTAATRLLKPLPMAWRRRAYARLARLRRRRGASSDRRLR